MYPVINPGCKHGPSDNKYISCEHVHVCVHHVLTDCVTINTCTIKEKQQHYMHRRHFYNVFSGRSRAIFHTVNSVQQLHLSLCICISQTWQLGQEKKAVKKKKPKEKVWHCGEKTNSEAFQDRAWWKTLVSRSFFMCRGEIQVQKTNIIK